MSNVICKSKLKIVGGGVLRRVLIITCEMLLRDHLRNINSTALFGSGRGIVGGLGDEL